MWAPQQLGQDLSLSLLPACLPVDPVPLNALPCLASKGKGKVEWGEDLHGGKIALILGCKVDKLFFKRISPSYQHPNMYAGVIHGT